MNSDDSESRLSDLRAEISDLENVEDSDGSDYIQPSKFSISSFGVDYNVDSLVKRMNSGAFYKPDFQREYVWSIKDASRFIESLLMGLPVPSLFIYKLENGKHLIIDGLQRLTTIQRFYRKEFSGKLFSLIDVREPWNGKTYETLEETDRLRLDDAVIHTTVFKQDQPQSDNRSVIEVFERINTGGLKLSPHEVRFCVSYSEDKNSSLLYLIKELNDKLEWREMYGPISSRMKDQELILRFFALLDNYTEYKRPFRTFLDDFAEANKKISIEKINFFRKIFYQTIELIYASLGRTAFRPQKSFNAAIFDSFAVAVATKLKKSEDITVIQIKNSYSHIIADSDYRELVSRSTADAERLKLRFEKAIERFL